VCVCLFVVDAYEGFILSAAAEAIILPIIAPFSPAT
jgi:hypothetical protein